MDATWKHRQRSRQALLLQLAAPEFTAQLRSLHSTGDVDPSIVSWSEYALLVQSVDVQSPEADAVLEPLLRLVRRDPRARQQLGSVLLAVLWDSLEQLHRLKRRWCPDEDERWARILFNFARAANLVWARRRTDRIAKRLLGETARLLYREAKRDWKRYGLEQRTEPGELARRIHDGTGMEHARLEFQRWAEQKRCSLVEEVRAGRIAEADLFLLISRHIYGRSLAESAEALGLDYETARKRLWRAERRRKPSD